MDEDAVDALADAIRIADTAVALSGAGVSTASGIPSFRGADGIWNEWDPAAFHRRRLDADPAGFWRDRVDLRAALTGGDPEPNDAHAALVTMEAGGHLDAVLTQNVDGLHTAAGSDRVVELHGANRRVRCDDCGATEPAEPAFERARSAVATGDDASLPPRCDCGGVYRPDVVLFGESLADTVLETAQRLARESDVFLAVGSSLSVRPAALLPRIALDSGATLAVVNFEETPQDDAADYLFRSDVTTVLPALADRL
ncbi:Sir2 family NAD-dependent protein deacetylase [Haloarcula onubensis]|uniref:NAD-dependent protein deacetylase n=1 Tax=Haloarcula onubensis TaxID=2950539 RepID=A0ABU2FN25_9EURY|nr:Sir2 family NAD-dependent protein deacetylase [Halomicroarcula sp. S3CR25-11]MDS0281702.1 NAD-dependent protein deacetylase [Halomicroarcula sp. S3CR25-11]